MLRLELSPRVRVPYRRAAQRSLFGRNTRVFDMPTDQIQQNKPKELQSWKLSC